MAELHQERFRHIVVEGASRCDDPDIIGLLERNFETPLPSLFTDFMIKRNGGILQYKFLHPRLPAPDNEFYIQRILTIGQHKSNSANDLIVYSDYQHFNEKLVPRKVVAFALDGRDWPIFLDFTETPHGRVVVHDDCDLLPKPTWIRKSIAYEFRYICDSFDEYIENLVPDVDEPGNEDPI